MADFEETLSAFVDRALTPDEEAEFLHILSVSPDKRSLLHDYMDMRGTFAADMRATSVPVHLDAAVMAGIAALTGATAVGAAAATSSTAAASGASATGGTAAPVPVPPSAGPTAAAPTAAAPTGAGGAFSWTLGRRISAVVLGAALCTTGWFAHDVFNASKNDGAAEQRSIEAPVSSDRSVLSDRSDQSDQSDRSTQTGQSDQASSANITARPRSRSAHDVGTAVPSRSGAPDGTPATQREAAAVVPVIVRLPGDTVVIVRTEQSYVPVQMPFPIELTRPVVSAMPRGPILDNLEFEVQREHATTYPYVDYHRLGVQRSEPNIAGLVTWRFDETHAVGVIIGRKAFAQEYYRMRGDSLDLYQQQPSLTYGAGFYRYALPLFTGVTPQAMVQVGGSDLGPVLGMRLAVTFAPFRNVQFVAGGTGMVLVYRYGSRLFTSQTLGVIYGVNVQF